MRYLLPIALFLLIQGAFAQSLPIHFEGDVGVSDFEDFDGGTFDLVANPAADAINASENVGQIVRNGGLIWSGSKMVIDGFLDFTENNSISMKVYTTAPVGTVVKFKLEGPAYTERDVLTTVSGAWEELSFDFTGAPLNSFNTLVFMFDFGNVGNGSETSTFYFDDINQGTNGEQLDLPVTFEDEVINYSVIDFGGNFSVLAEDPTDPENTVVKTIKSATAEGWAGTTIGTAAGFINNIPLTLTDSKMSVRVWSATAGTLVRLKVEAATNATHTCETQTTTTLAGAWEVLEFDFANEAPGTAMLSTGIDGGWTYNKASIFFNYDIPGTQAGELTFYFDDVYFGEIEVGTAEITARIANAYPNPTSDAWTISSEDNIQQVMVMNTQGQVVLSINSDEHKVSIDAAELAKGVYFAQVITNKGMTSIQLQKQ